MIFKGKLSDLIGEANSMPWKFWVYSEPFVSLTPDTRCMALDADNVDLGVDRFTPLEVEKCCYKELISMQELQVIIKKANPSKVVDEIDYYVKNDAYLP